MNAIIINPVTVIDEKGDEIGTFDRVTKFDGEYLLAMIDEDEIYPALYNGEGIPAPANWKSLIPTTQGEPEWGSLTLKPAPVIYYPDFRRAFLDSYLTGEARCPNCETPSAVLLRSEITGYIKCHECDDSDQDSAHERGEVFLTELRAATLEAHY